MKPGQTLRTTIGLVGAATGSPTAKLIHNGAFDNAVTVTPVPGPGTNQYSLSAAIPTTGYVAGDTVLFSFSATVNGSSMELPCGRSIILESVDIGTVLGVAPNPDGVATAVTTTTVTVGRDDWIASLAAVGGLTITIAGQSALVATRSGLVLTLTGQWSGALRGSPVGPPSAGAYAIQGSVGVGLALGAAGLDAIPVESGVNARQALSPILASAAGIVAGAGTGVVVVKGGNVGTTRITATCDPDGNRTAVTLNLPG